MPAKKKFVECIVCGETDLSKFYKSENMSYCKVCLNAWQNRKLLIKASEYVSRTRATLITDVP